MIQKDQHTILVNLEEHGYKGINEYSKVCYLIAGIKSVALNSIKAKILASAQYCQYYDVIVIIYIDYIKKAHDTNSKFNISAGEKRIKN